MMPADRARFMLISVKTIVAVVVCHAFEFAWLAQTGERFPLAVCVGVGLALVLSWGPRTLLVFSLALMLARWVSGGWPAGHPALEVLADTLADTLAVGAASFLLSRRPRRHPRLGTPRELAGFALVCAVAGGVRAVLGHFWEPGDADIWRTWTGQTLGLLIVAPATLSWVGEPQGDWRPRRVLLGSLTPALAVAVAIGHLQVSRVLDERERSRFAQEAADREVVLASRVQAALDALRTVRSLFAVAPELDRAGFAAAVREWSERYDLHAMGISVRLDAERVPAFEDALRADGAPDPSVRSAVGDGTFRPLRPGEGIVAIRLIEPWDRNAQVLGTNSLANPRVAQAVERSWATGGPAATAPFPLLLRAEGPAKDRPLPLGVVIYQALPPSAADGVVDASPGVAFVTLRVDRVALAVQAGLASGAAMCLQDDFEGVSQVLAEVGPMACRLLAGSDVQHVRRFDVDVGDRAWVLRLSPAPSSTAVADAMLSVSSMSLVALLGLLFLSMTGHARLFRRAADLARAAQQAAEAATRAKSDFLVRMNHELRAPLNGIVGYAQMLRAGADPSSPQVECWAAEIEQAGWHLRDLIDDLAEARDVRVDSVAVSDETLPLGPVVRAAAGMVLPQARQRSVAIAVELLDPCWRVRGDARRLRQVLVNLLSNAIKYNHPGGRVSVSVAADPSTVSVQVVDTGIGMSANQLSALFRPFDRLGREATNIEGSGLGLVVSQRLIERMGGRLNVCSREHAGSTFTIVLRRASDEQALPDTAREPTAVIMAFEDDPVAIELLKEMIAARPHLRLVVHEESRGAAEHVRALRPRLILLDRHLTDGDAFGVLDELRRDEALAAIPVFLTSGDLKTTDSDGHRADGIVGIHPKPWNLQELAAAIDRVVA